MKKGNKAKQEKQEWRELTRLTDGAPIVIERVRFQDKDISIEGNFEFPPLARLSMEDQEIVTRFIISNGSIKDLESHLRCSYPTVKSHLKRIAKQLLIGRS